MKSIIFITSFLLVSISFAATDVINTPVRNTLSQNTATNTTVVNNAKAWDLSETEWMKYLALMQGNAGHYYPQLTPPAILGHYAKDAEERRHYAEITARQEHERLERELLFNQAFHEAAQRLYAGEPLIKPLPASLLIHAAKAQPARSETR